MTTQQFLKHLKSIIAEWLVVGREGIIRMKHGDDYICPICAVANHILEEPRFTVDNAHANSHLKLPRDLFRKITSAADGCTYTPGEERMRKTLMKLLKPTDVSPEPTYIP